MPIHMPEVDEIYFPKTREYFKEVISSYSNGNYRSATVMLYSVAVCDILFKLQELKEMYNDSTAIAILKKVEKERQESTSKSSWEKTLLDEIAGKTQLLDLKARSDLNHLFDDRNLSAHPAMNENYELISPTQETTIAHIKNILNQVLVKPPIFIKSVIDILTDDLKDKKNIYLNAADELDTYLNNKYYRHMTDSMKIKVFKTMWRFCFRNTDNDDCKSNRSINRMALSILANSCFEVVKTEIRNNPNDFTVTNENDCLGQLTIFLSKNPSIYQLLPQDTRLSLEKYVDENDYAKWCTWFRFKTLKEHIDYLKNARGLQKSKREIGYMYDYYVKNGNKELVLEFFIYFYINSQNYSDADERYYCVIYPYLKEFNSTQIRVLIKGIDHNRQVYDRNAAYRTNCEIVNSREASEFDGFDFEQHPNFRFDKNILEAERTQNDEDFELPF